MCKLYIYRSFNVLTRSWCRMEYHLATYYKWRDSSTKMSRRCWISGYVLLLSLIIYCMRTYYCRGIGTGSSRPCSCWTKVSCALREPTIKLIVIKHIETLQLHVYTISIEQLHYYISTIILKCKILTTTNSKLCSKLCACKNNSWSF